MSKKDKFKKITDGVLKRTFLNKNLFYKKNINNIIEHLKKNKIILKRYLRKIKTFIYINLNFKNLTKKSIGSRMGKGKGSNTNFFFLIPAGFPLMFLLNWNNKILKYLIFFLIKILPGKNYFII